MTPKKKRYRIWLAQAAYDLQAAKHSKDAGNHEWACYQANQCVEKAIKAVIVHAGWRPPKVHKLGVLMGIANKANKLFFDIRFDYRKIESYTFISRYPFLIPGENSAPHEFITKNDSDTCVRIADEIYGKIDEFLHVGDVEHAAAEESVIRVDEPYYFTKEEVAQKTQEVIEAIQTSDLLDVKKIILYGGFAREKTRPRTSTMDILVVAETELPFIERIQHVREITRGGELIVEPLIYTPNELDQLLNEIGEGYLESALEEGKVLWEVPNAG